MNAEIVIAGGGLNGMTLALALASAGLTVALVDPVPPPEAIRPGFDGRGYALSVASKRVLKALGVWDQLEGETQPILDIRITDGEVVRGPGPAILDFDHAEIEEGPLGVMVEDRHLRPALFAAVDAAATIRRIQATVTDHVASASGVAVTLSTGETLRTRLLVGSDGRASPTARRAGIRRHGWRYGQTALVCALRHERPHEGRAHQYFLPAGPLAILPLPGNRSAIVWTERDAAAKAIQALDDDGYLAVLRPCIGGFLGEITLEGDRFAYPLELSLTDRLVAPRVALVGDAAHVVHPVAGQGLNAGLKDIAALAETLADAQRRGEDIGRGDVLARYQTWRRFDIAALAFATDTTNRLFSNDRPLIRLARRTGLALVARLPDLRRGFVREAAGLTGDLPRLARGRPL